MRHTPLVLLLTLCLTGCPTGTDDDTTTADDDTEGDDDTADDDTADDDGGDDDSNDDDTGDDDDSGGPWDPYSLLSLNLHCLFLDGTSFAFNWERVEAIAAFVAAEGVKVIAMQEVCRTDDYSITSDFNSALVQATGSPWTHRTTFTHVAWDGTPDEADEYVSVWVQGSMNGAETTYHVQGPLTRVEVSATIDPVLGGLRVTSVHFEVSDPGVRDAQARQSTVAALQATDPDFAAVVMGDFNATEGTVAHSSFLAMGFEDLSADLDEARIDHVFAHRGADLEMLEARLVFDGVDGPVVSDHPGVLVRIQPGTGDAIAPTRFTALHDPGPEHYLALRGDAPPLGWDDRGWPAVEAAAGQWEVVMTEIAAGPFEYKWLLDDVDWQQGNNETGTGQTDHVTSPAF